MGTDTANLITELEGFLQVERHMIRNGQFEGLERLATEKARLLTALTGTPAQMLTRARDLADANQQLFDAALKGVRAAQRRLDMVQRANHCLDSYDQLGRARSIGNGDSSVERRA